MGMFIKAFWQGTLVACALSLAACNQAPTGGEPQTDDADKGDKADTAAGSDGVTGSAAQAIATNTCIDIRRDDGYLVQDSFIASNGVTTNWGSNINVLVGKVTGNLRQSVFQFDTTSIPKRAQIISATLKLYILNTYSLPASAPVNVYRVTVPWTEGTVDWNVIHPGGGNGYATPAIASAPPTVGAFNINVLSTVQAWVTDGLAGTSGTFPNHGILLDQPLTTTTATEYTTFRSSETSTTYGTNYPTLSVCYVVQGPPATSMVNAGTLSTSPNYWATYTLGQSSANQGKMTSLGFRAQGGIQGAMGTLP
jgi:hypothetical protein